jgi:hypothetical protein
MRHSKLFGVAVLVITAALMLVATSCFGSTGPGGSTSGTPAIVKPQPVVESTSATTSGTADSYFTTLDINVKNSGADGIILVTASVTQNGKTAQQEASSFIKNGENRPFELTFPLVWKGGDFTYTVQASLP